MKKHALIPLVSLLVACSPRGPDPEVVQALAEYDDASARITGSMVARPSSFRDEPDFRGQTYAKEYAQRVMTPETSRHLDELREKAENASSVGAANLYLGEARDVLAVESARAHGINQYWTAAKIAPYWRKYWNGLFDANEAPVASPDPLLLSIEARMREALDRGDFQRAADEAKTLPPVLSEAMNRAAGNLVKARKDKVVFAARRTPCLPVAPVARTMRKAQIQKTEELESFYPEDALLSGIQGTVVLGVNVDVAGCGKDVAVVVRSGVPALDLAALGWFETARFAPAWRDGKPVQSILNFKIRFRLEEPGSPDMAEVVTADSRATDAPPK